MSDDLYQKLKASKNAGLGHLVRRAFTATLPPKFGSRSHLVAVIDRVAGQMPRPRVLMIGSNLPPAALPPRTADYVQIDIQSMPYTRCRCDAEALPFCDGTFDVVVATSMLEHTPHPWRVVDEMARVCRPDTGLVYIAVPWQFPLHGEPYDFWRFSMPGLKHLCRGLDVLDSGSEAGPVSALSTFLAYGIARAVSFNSRALMMAGLWLGKWLTLPLSLVEVAVFRARKQHYAQDAMLYVICRVPSRPVVLR